MTASKPVSRPLSAELIGETDLAKVDALVIEPHEYDEIPEITDELLDRADFYIGNTFIRHGRPRSEPSKTVTVRLEQDVLDGLRATGPGWQARVNQALREWLATRAA